MRWPFPLTSSSTRFLRFRFIPFQSHSSHHNNFSTHNPIPVPITYPVLDQTTVRETLISFNNDWKRALEFFNWVQTEFNFPHSTETYNLILDILGKFFEFQQCWNLIHRMQNNPNSFPNHTTFRVMFKRYISAHCIDDAVQTFQRLNEFNLKDETSFSNLIDALCDHKHVLEAQDLVFGTQKTLTLSWKIDGIVVSSNNTKIYNIVLRGWYKLGWWSKCWEFWDEMDRKGVQKDLHSYSIYMDILSKGGKPWKAVKLFQEMKRKGIKLDVVVYNIAIRAIGVSQGVDFSIRLFREMKDAGFNPTVVTYNTIIRLLCDSYRYKEALALLRTMRHNGCFPTAVSYQCFFSCLEKPKLIVDLFDGMIESGVRPTMDTYVMLLKKFSRWGFLRLVFVVWNRMEQLGCSPDAAAYNALIDALVEKGLINMARKYDEEMLAKGLSPRPRKELGTKVLGGEFVEE
ncbi:pentatricopeptide repeat-containing protein At1g80550, mitochondrial [Cicer arietinum]|uniref:Pentatricopeptide repeat-containing protein At1g80550, mitochondrial n=1 Tax=Cicer arietinum TaxID=3827 RepID=A0A1S3E781_CICAR|nr:pentatricopeptide repeat-containing protein At1g80550, mitochondrial [Cicer arietinum]